MKCTKSIFRFNNYLCSKLDVHPRLFSSVAGLQSSLFNEEQIKQRNNVGRIEKIEVRYLGLPNDMTLIMNKDISTPYHCAQHFNEGICKRSALALLDGKIAWDMHRPLEKSCTLQLMNFNAADPHVVNKAFWRSCSFLLGAALTSAFKEKAGLIIHSFPGPNVKSGSFVHDIVLSANDWNANPKELRAFSAEMRKLAARDYKIERLDVDIELALKIFKTNPYKTEQIPNIASHNNGHVTLYRIGDHVDISRGPMISSSGLLGKCTISSVHKIGSYNKIDTIYRVQGVALPSEIIINHSAFSVLEERSKKLNPARLPTEPYEELTEQRIG